MCGGIPMKSFHIINDDNSKIKLEKKEKDEKESIRRKETRNCKSEQ
jgi:hypothetical protein